MRTEKELLFILVTFCFLLRWSSASTSRDNSRFYCSKKILWISLYSCLQENILCKSGKDLPLENSSLQSQSESLMTYYLLPCFVQVPPGLPLLLYIIFILLFCSASLIRSVISTNVFPREGSMHVCKEFLIWLCRKGRECSENFWLYRKINSPFLQNFIMRKLHYQIVNDFTGTKSVSLSEISLT